MILWLLRVLIRAPKLGKAQCNNGQSGEKPAERGPQRHDFENSESIVEIAEQTDQLQRLEKGSEKLRILGMLEGSP